MKKLSALLFGFMLLVPQTLAATIASDFSSDLDKQHIQSLWPVNIKATADSEITAEHGITIMLNFTDPLIWENKVISVSGTAVSNGKIDSKVVAEYSKDYKVLHIPVKADFVSGEQFKVSNLSVRTYDYDTTRRYLELDINGDLVADAVDFNGYRVMDVDDTDNTHPYAIYDVESAINVDGSVTLSWAQPADYDIQYVRVDKWVTTNGMTSYKPKVFYEQLKNTYTDSALSGVDEVKYNVTAIDYVGFVSPDVYVTLDLTAPAVEEEPTEEPIDEEEEVTEDDEEVGETEEEELSRLLNYYRVRYSIKCMPSGVPAAENDSNCLWARIDLLYAQEKTGQSLVSTALSDRDVSLMESRRRWPELRYQENCVDAAEPASYCPALGKALNRIAYFLD